MRRFARKGWLLLGAMAVLGGGSLFVTGCGPSGPGLGDKPPPKGGPPASTRKPPGEVNSPNTR